jgi:XTP/dITP diphosphohydrolase
VKNLFLIRIVVVLPDKNNIIFAYKIRLNIVMEINLVFATNNEHKLTEVKDIVGNTFRVLSLKDIGCFDDIPETADTLEGNVLLKARHVKQKYGYDCFADDTGLEIRALHNAPGIYSARYAGEAKDPKANMRKVLGELQNQTDRSACFRTVIALITGEEEYLLEGSIEGTIIDEPRGKAGFGYDPIFVPKGYTETFAEMEADVKNSIRHRAEAIKKLKQLVDAKQKI